MCTPGWRGDPIFHVPASGLGVHCAGTLGPMRSAHGNAISLDSTLGESQIAICGCVADWISTRRGAVRLHPTQRARWGAQTAWRCASLGMRARARAARRGRWMARAVGGTESDEDGGFESAEARAGLDTSTAPPCVFPSLGGMQIPWKQTINSWTARSICC